CRPPSRSCAFATYVDGPTWRRSNKSRAPRCPLLGSPDGSRLGRRERLPALHHRQHLLGEQLEPALGHRIGRTAEAECHVHLEIADHLTPRLEPAQDLLRRPPAGGLHEAGDRAIEPALAGDLRLLLVGIVALHRLEVLAEELIVIEIALDELALIPARL